jgi:hypothetical protein
MNVYAYGIQIEKQSTNGGAVIAVSHSSSKFFGVSSVNPNLNQTTSMHKENQCLLVCMLLNLKAFHSGRLLS